jgi:hypothetical protein
MPLLDGSLQIAHAGTVTNSITTTIAALRRVSSSLNSDDVSLDLSINRPMTKSLRDFRGGGVGRMLERAA